MRSFSLRPATINRSPAVGIATFGRRWRGLCQVRQSAWWLQTAKMTISSASEEKWVENDILHAKMYFNMPYALTTAGGDVTTGSVDFEPHVVVDRELITGQNPRSDHQIAAKLIEALAARAKTAA